MPKIIAPVDPESFAAQILALSKKPSYAANLAANKDFYRTGIPPWLQYFTQQHQNQQPGTKMAYLQNWQPSVAGIKNWDEPGQVINYHAPLAYLTGMKQGINWEDVTGAGAQWHGRDMSPGGQRLKAPWHPAFHYEDEMVLQNMLEQAKKKTAKK